MHTNIYELLLKHGNKKVVNLPGDSWSLITCLSVKSDRLWTRVMLWRVWQFEQTVGSAILPRSTATVVVLQQTEQRKKATKWCTNNEAPLNDNREQTLSHFRNEWRHSNNHTADGNKLINIWNNYCLHMYSITIGPSLTFRIQHSHVLCHLCIIWTHLYVQWYEWANAYRGHQRWTKSHNTLHTYN